MRSEDVRQRVDQILETYEGDPDAGHYEEDQLLAEFIERVAGCHDTRMTMVSVARELTRLLDAERTKWYA